MLATNPTMTGEATAAYLADRLRDRVTRHAARERPPGRRRPRVRRRGHARPRARRPARDVSCCHRPKKRAVSAAIQNASSASGISLRRPRRRLRSRLAADSVMRSVRNSAADSPLRCEPRCARRRRSPSGRRRPRAAASNLGPGDVPVLGDVTGRQRPRSARPSIGSRMSATVREIGAAQRPTQPCSSST